MTEIKNELHKVENGDFSLAVTKGYSYQNKDGKTRYGVCDVYYVEEDGSTKRKHENEKGTFYYNVTLEDVVIETFLMKDGTPGSKTYSLSEVPYLAGSADDVDLDRLADFLAFKLHR